MLSIMRVGDAWQSYVLFPEWIQDIFLAQLPHSGERNALFMRVSFFSVTIFHLVPGLDWLYNLRWDFQNLVDFFLLRLWGASFSYS